MTKFQNKYRTTSHRMPYWDYSGNGIYFITLVIQNRECNLGEIVKTDDRVYLCLSEFGKIVNDEWLKSFEIRQELFCDEYIIMPNHLHAIVVLKKIIVDTHGRAYQRPDERPDEQPNEQPNERPKPQPEFIRKSKSISSFIAGFKSAINSKIDDYIDEQKLDIPKYNRNNHFFQPNYHDRIIRNDTEHQRIKQYIIHNPLKWNDNTFNSMNKNIGK